MKIICLLILFTINAFCQDLEKFIAYGNMGFGLSRGGYQESQGGTVARLGVSVSYYHLLFKVDRTRNNEFALIEPPEKITSYSYLVGISIQPFRNLPELLINGKYGIGKGELIKRGKIIVYKLLDNEYDFISEKYSTNIVELDLELRFQYFGMYLGGFSEFNQGFNVYGITLGALFGNF